MEKLIELNERLDNAPLGLLVIGVSIACGYVLKVVQAFPNRFIPLAVICTAALLFLLGAPENTGNMPARVWIVRNFGIGVVLGFASWLFHRSVLKRLEERYGLFKALGEGDDPVSDTTDAKHPPPPGPDSP